MSKAKKRWIILLSIFIGVILAASLTFYFVFDVKNWQKLDASKLTVLAQTSTLYDGQENIITTLKGSENRTLVTIDDIPLHTQQAFIAAEDVRFYEHSGIDVYRIFGALRSNLQSGSLAEGASTITQQLAKLTHLSSEKTLRRKLEEIYLAFQIERTYSKNEILTMYLNTVYFGAAHTVFKPPHRHTSVLTQKILPSHRAHVWLLSLKRRPSMRRISARKAIKTAEITS